MAAAGGDAPPLSPGPTLQPRRHRRPGQVTRRGACLRAPNIWFRARLRYADSNAPEGKVDVTGFTLPGLPLILLPLEV